MKFDKEKAAKFFIVAWVKDWSIETYLKAIFNGEKYIFDDVHLSYPWIPKNVFYLVKNKMRIQRFAAENMRLISNALWSADSNEKRLTIAKQVEHWTTDITKTRVVDGKKEMIKQRKRYLAQSIAFSNEKENAEKLNRTAWNQVK